MNLRRAEVLHLKESSALAYCSLRVSFTCGHEALYLGRSYSGRQIKFHRVDK